VSSKPPFTPREMRLLAGVATPEDIEDNRIVYKNWTRRELRMLSGRNYENDRRK